jgi:hypothetical protein
MQRVAEGSCLMLDVFPPAGDVAEGTNNPNQERRGGRTAPEVDGGCRRVTAASSAEGAKSCREGRVITVSSPLIRRTNWMSSGMTVHLLL